MNSLSILRITGPERGEKLRVGSSSISTLAPDMLSFKSNTFDIYAYNGGLFKPDAETAEKLSSQWAVCAMDEGTFDTSYADYLLDIIPSVELMRKANRTEPGFISLPEHRKSDKEIWKHRLLSQLKIQHRSGFKTLF